MAFILTIPFGLSLATSTVTPPDRREFITANNQLMNARYINPVTLDYELSDNGNFVGMNLIDQQVYLAIITTFNTACQSDLGNKLRSVKLITPDIVLRVTNIINSALSALINAGSVILGNIAVSVPSPNTVNISFTWTNTQTNQTEVMNLPVGN